MNKLRSDLEVAVIISPDHTLHKKLEAALTSASAAEAVWLVPHYPELKELERLKEVRNGCVLFLDFADAVRARRIAAHIDRAHPETSVIAVHAAASRDDLLTLMQLGIREVITDAASPPEVLTAFSRATRKLNGNLAGSNNIYAFVPAKPGAGATTIVTNVAWMISKSSSMRTLLLDFDLRLGITSFLMKLDGRHSIQDALSASERLDSNLWEKLVCRRDNLDALGSAPCQPVCDIRVEAFTAVLDYAREAYGAVCVDLPGSLEPYEIETLRRAQDIFLVCTPDVAGLHMAKRKAETLRSLNLSESATVVVNRVDKNTALPIADVECILDLPVRFVVPSDNRGISRSIESGNALDAKCPAGTQIATIAKSIVGSGPPEISGGGPKKRFIEYFSISPIRERKIWKS